MMPPVIFSFSRDVMVQEVGVKNCSFHRETLFAAGCILYQKKRPYLYSDNSGYTRELSAPCGVEQDISIDGKWESIERTCSTAEGE